MFCRDKYRSFELFPCVWIQSATFRVQSIVSILRRARCVNEDPTAGKEEEKQERKKNKQKKTRHLSSLVSVWSAKPLRPALEAVVSDAGL